MDVAIFDTPIGFCRISGNKAGISNLSLMDEPAQLTPIPPDLADAVAQITEYFNHKRTEFSFAINPSGTAFQQSVWAALQRVPYGKTLTYLELAKLVGDAKSIRAVASANAKNPLWIVVPCHRIIGSNGSLTGYAGKLWRKKWLLEHESPSGQQQLF